MCLKPNPEARTAIQMLFIIMVDDLHSRAAAPGRSPVSSRKRESPVEGDCDVVYNIIFKILCLTRPHGTIRLRAIPDVLINKTIRIHGQNQRPVAANVPTIAKNSHKIQNVFLPDLKIRMRSVSEFMRDTARPSRASASHFRPHYRSLDGGG